MIYGDTITILRAPVTTDRYGNEVRGWPNATRTPVDRVSVQPRSATESGSDEAREMVTTGWRIYTRAGVDLDVEPTDRIEWSGRTLEVIGEIARWPHPIRRGAVHHVEFDVQRWSG